MADVQDYASDNTNIFAAVGAALCLTVVLVVVLCASLIARPVPCEDYPPKIDMINSYILTTGEDETAEYPFICFSQARDFERVILYGQFFDLSDMSPSGGTLPTITVGEYEVKNATVYRHKCEGINVYRRPNVYVCPEAEMEIPYQPPSSTTNAGAIWDVKMVNTEPCDDMDTTAKIGVVWEELLNLAVTSLEPAVICQNSLNSPRALFIQGSGFLRYVPNDGEDDVLQPLVAVGGIFVDSEVNEDSCTDLVTTADATIQVCTQIYSDFPNITDSTGFLNQLIIRNPFPCLDSFIIVENAFTISNRLAIVYYVEPQTILNTVPFQVHILTSGFTERPQKIQLNAPGSSVFYTWNDFTTDGSDVNSLFISISTNLLPSNTTYDVIVTGAAGCRAVLPAAVTVTSITNIDVQGVQPTHIYDAEVGGFTISSFAANAGPSGNNKEFAELPNVFLIPSGSGTAIPLNYVNFVNSLTLSVSVPPDTFSPGNYRVVVVNPDGSAGIYTAGITVVGSSLPRIDSITKTYLLAGATDTVTIRGANFVTGLTLTTSCLVYPATTTAGSLTVGTVTFVDSTRVTATLTASALEVGAYCTVRLTNPDGANFLFSAITIKASSGNLLALTTGTTLVEGRRALSIATGKVTPSQAIIYAIGGEGSIGTNRKSSVERSFLSAQGTVGAWSMDSRDALPNTLSFHKSEVVGRFVYTVGGTTDVQTAIASTWRALILDPLEVPVVEVAIGISNETSPGLSAGRWYYAVSAVYGANDKLNPGGEGLPSPVLSVTLPTITVSGYKLFVDLSWDDVPRAVSYRVYRSPTPNSAISSLRLLGTTTDTDFLDTGLTTTAPTPLTVGALGKWHSAVDSNNNPISLNTERKGHAMVKSQSLADPNIYFLHVLGGRDNSNAVVSTYEVLQINTASPEHTISPWVENNYPALSGGGGGSVTATADLSAAVLRPTDPAGNLGVTSNWIYFGGGNSGAGGSFTNIQTVYAASIASDGTFASVSQPSGDLKAAMSGHCITQAAGTFLAMGVDGTAENGTPSTNNRGREASLSSAPPALPNNAFNPSPAAAFPTARRYLACSIQNGIIIEVGGNVADGSGTNQVYTVVQ